MKNILTSMEECAAILQTLIHDVGSHQVQAADLAIRLRTAANLLDPPENPGSVSRPHGMVQTVVQRSTVLADSDDSRSLRDQLQQEFDRYHSGGTDFGGTFREVETASVRVGDRIRILDITLYYRQWTEFIVHRIERYSAHTRGICYFVSRDDGIRQLIYAVGTYEPYLIRTYYLPVEEHAFTPEQHHGADPAQSKPGQSESH